MSDLRDDCKTQDWAMMFRLLVSQKEKSGQVSLLQSFTVSDETGAERKLGLWLQNQPERAKKLESIGVVARVPRERGQVWDKTFQILVAVALSRSFTVTDDTGVERNLGMWLRNQRMAMAKPTFDP